jgi:hypothetical protein
MRTEIISFMCLWVGCNAKITQISVTEQELKRLKNTLFMPLMNLKLIILLCFSFYIFSCSSTKFTKTNNNNFTSLEPNTKTYFLTQNDSIPTNLVLIGEFKHLEDNNLSWQYMKDKISQNALINGANFIKIDKYNVLAVQTDGHSAKITGRYFKSENSIVDENFKVSNKESNEIGKKNVYLFRNEGGAFLRSAFPIHVFLDGKEIGELPNKSYFELKVDDSNKHFLSTSQNGANSILLDFEHNKSLFINVTQNMSSSNLGVNIGNKNFHIFETLEGKLSFETVKNEGKKIIKKPI